MMRAGFNSYEPLESGMRTRHRRDMKRPHGESWTRNTEEVLITRKGLDRIAVAVSTGLPMGMGDNQVSRCSTWTRKDNATPGPEQIHTGSDRVWQMDLTI